MTEERKVKIFCGTCNGLTNHDVIDFRDVDAHPEEDYKWGQRHYFCQCAGCDSFSYAVRSWTEDDWNEHTDGLDYRWEIYPRGTDVRESIDDVFDLPDKVRVIYLEVIGALNASLPVLTAIGLRAVIEAICKDRAVPGKNLEELIDNLATAGVLSSDQAKILHGHRFLGNVAAHEIKSAKPKEILAALEIAEAMMRTIYVLPQLSASITTGKKP